MIAASFFGSTAGLVILTVLVFGAAFLVFYLLVGTGMRVQEDRRMAERMSSAGKPGAGSTPAPVRPQSSTGWIPGVALHAGGRVAEAGGFTQRLDADLEAAGYPLKSAEFVVITVGALLVGGAVGAVIFPNWPLALVTAVVCGLIPTVVLRTGLNRRADKLRSQLADVLTIMASSLRAGHSFLQSLDTVAKEVEEPAASEFSRVVAEVRLGRPSDEALTAMAERIGSEDFKWAVIAIGIQREVGGNLAEILDTVADTIRERETLRRQIQVLTSEGRLSAYVLIALPLAIAAYMFLVNPDYIGLLFTTTIGLVMVVTAVCLLIIGIYWMRKVIDIDV